MKFTAKNITYLAMLTSILILLQSLASFGFLTFGQISINLTLVPIMIGVILLGFWPGVFLGFVSSLLITIYSISQGSGFVYALFQYKPIITIILIFVKGCVAPLVASIIYKVLAKKSELVGTWTSFIVCPIVNTVIFCVGMFVFFVPFLKGEFGANVVYTVFITLVGINFLLELAINIVCAPAVYRVNKIVNKI